MNYLPYWIILAIITTSVMPSWAATVIERSGFREDKQLVTLDKHLARIGSAKCGLRILRGLKRETADCDIYTLLDLQKKKAYLVNKPEKTVVKMDIEGKPMKLPENLLSMRQQLQQSSKKDKPITAKLEKIDKSPFIAGYPTVVYQVTANGKVCSKIYFSQKAAKIPFFKEFIDAMRKLSSSRQPPRPKGMPIPPCRQAHDELKAEFFQLGIPMKMVIKGDKGKSTKEKEGKRKNKIIFHKISKIKKNIKISPEKLALPKDYKIMTEQQMQAQQQAQFEQWQQAQQQRGKRYSQQRDRQRGDYDMPARGRDGERRGYYSQERWREDDRRGEGYYPPPPPKRWREDDRQGDDGYYQSPRARIQEGERGAEGYYPPPPKRWREDDRRGEDGYPPDGWSQERDPYYNMPPPGYRDDRSGNDY